MRLEAQMKGGFYPCPKEAIDQLVAKVTPCDGATLLDPCAGRGEAAKWLAEGLGIAEKDVYAVELKEGRSAAIRAAMPEAKILAPADFMQTDCSAHGLSFVWCNPPFDDEIGGGGRIEYGFLQRSIRLVATKGLVGFVCPEHVMMRRDIRELLMSECDNISVTPFPAGVRKYGEVVTLANRRTRPVEAASGDWLATLARNKVPRYALVPAPGPRRFAKTGLTDLEILRALARSPLNAIFTGAGAAPMPSPPLELGRGQLALVLAGGMLNTTLQKPGEPAILIKATPYKETYVSSEEEETKNAGTDREDVVKTVVTSERIKLKVRVMDAGGTIHDLT